MGQIASVLLEGLLDECAQARSVLESIGDTSLDCCPVNGMRPLVDLANHLVQIPMMDLAIYSGQVKDSNVAQDMEKQIRTDTLDAMIKVFDRGVEMLKKQFSEMSDTEVLNADKRPFYSKGPPHHWAFFMSEMARHIAMHKMQIWM